jgi:hypothetical protein
MSSKKTKKYKPQQETGQQRLARYLSNNRSMLEDAAKVGKPTGKGAVVLNVDEELKTVSLGYLLHNTVEKMVAQVGMTDQYDLMRFLCEPIGHVVVVAELHTAKDELFYCVTEVSA